MEKQTKRLFRSRANKVFGGVCGGIGEYFGIDPIILRIIAVVLAIVSGHIFLSLLVYVIAWICIPKYRPDASGSQNNESVGP